MPAHMKAMPDGQLARVVYRSRSLLPSTPDRAAGQVSELLRVARHNNSQFGLTGVLLFDGTNFLQAIEGEMADVEALFENIACDLRHEEIELIEFKPIAARDYRAFPMAYVEGLAAEHGTLQHLQAVLGVPAVEADVPAVG